jgi:hypothetical protein
VGLVANELQLSRFLPQGVSGSFEIMYPVGLQLTILYTPAKMMPSQTCTREKGSDSINS